MNHTNEPWRLTDDGTFVEVMAGEKTVLPAIRKSEAGDDFRRIVACVNACEGLDTELLEKIVALGGTLPRRLEAMTNWERSEAEKQRDELRAALEYLRQHKLWANGHAKAVIESALEKVGADRTAPEGHNAALKGGEAVPLESTVMRKD